MTAPAPDHCLLPDIQLLPRERAQLPLLLTSPLLLLLLLPAHITMAGQGMSPAQGKRVQQGPPTRGQELNNTREISKKLPFLYAFQSDGHFHSAYRHPTLICVHKEASCYIYEVFFFFFKSVKSPCG